MIGRKSTPTARLKVLLVFASFLYVAVFLLREKLFTVLFPFEVDPSDGDIFNSGIRILRGLPLYGEWLKGELLTAYTPLLSALIAAFSVFFKSETTIVILRALNILFFLGAAFALLFSIRPHLKSNEFYPTVFVFLALFFLKNMNSSTFLTILRPDALLFFLCGLGCLFVLKDRPNPWVLALLTGACFLAKQNGVIFGVSAAIFLLFFHRNLFWCFLKSNLILGLPLLALLEFLNGGNFIKSTLLSPTLYYSPISSQADYRAALLADYYTNVRTFHFLGFLAGVGYCFRNPRIIFFLIFLIVDFVVFWRLGKNPGGNNSYLWLNWSLFCLLFSFGFVKILDSLIQRLPKLKGKTQNIMFILALIFFSSSLIRSRSVEKIFGSWKVGLDFDHIGLEQGQKLTEKILEIERDHNGTTYWLSFRMSFPLVHAGVLLHHEFATLSNYVFHGEGANGFFDKLLRSGKVTHVLTSEFIPAYLNEPLSHCFDSVFEVADHRKILRNNGKCRR